MPTEQPGHGSLDGTGPVGNHERVFMNGHSPISAADADSTTDTGAPSGRRAVRAQEIRSRLLAAAAALVGERQSAAITARDIARAAGTSDGVLYNHFADKHELILAALVGRFERLVGEFQAEIAMGSGATRAAAARLDGRLEHLANATFRLHAASLPMLANVLSEPGLFHRFMLAIHRPPLGGHVFTDPAEELVRAERAAGRAGDVEPSAVADLLVGSVLMLALVELLGGRSREDSEARLRAVVRTLVLGVAPRSPSR